MTRLHLPNAIVMRLRVRKIYVIIPNSRTAGTAGVLSSCPTLSVGFSIQDETAGVVVVVVVVVVEAWRLELT